jgi:hypothetical protein
VTEGFLCDEPNGRLQRLPLAEERLRRIRLRRREDGAGSKQPLGCNERGGQEDRLRSARADAMTRTIPDGSRSSTQQCWSRSSASRSSSSKARFSTTAGASAGPRPRFG